MLNIKESSDPSALSWSTIKLLLRPGLLVTVVQPTGAHVKRDEQVQHLKEECIAHSHTPEKDTDHDNNNSNTDTAHHIDMVLNLALHQSKAALDKSSIGSSWSDHTSVLVQTH
jgi:hypothetical protein